MTGTAPGSGPRSWAADWVEICQSEWRAMAADRELADAAADLAARWAEGYGAAWALAGLFAPAPPNPDGPAGRAASGAAAGSAAALAASAAIGATDDDARRRIAQLAERVAELERRLAGLEPGGA